MGAWGSVVRRLRGRLLSAKVHAGEGYRQLAALRSYGPYCVKGHNASEAAAEADMSHWSKRAGQS